MKLKYYEKLTILIVLFIGATIATGYIVGSYVKEKNLQKEKAETRIILK